MHVCEEGERQREREGTVIDMDITVVWAFNCIVDDESYLLVTW